MKKIIEQALTLIKSGEEVRKNSFSHLEADISLYRDSVHKKANTVIAMARDHESRFLLVISDREAGLIGNFSGERISGMDGVACRCPLNEQNAEMLRKLFPWTAPVSLRDRKTTVGCGDRLGLATAGHIAAVREFELAPVLAQQSMRELTLTGRTYRGLVDDATFMVYQCGYKDGYGADGDHLKTIADIDTALGADMPMITLDLSEVMNAAAGDWSDAEIGKAFAGLPGEKQKYFEEIYFNKEFTAGEKRINMDAAVVRRCAVMYLKALDFAQEVHAHLQAERGDQFDLEISIDETTSPTLPSHHLFIVMELRKRGVEFTSLAPRFIGEFQKAVDYIGDPEEFARQFRVHADIAKTHGDYKISIHSGSDKFMVYPVIGAMTGMRLHLKTAGTSWLEAVRVIAENDPALYRLMHKCALANFKAMLKLYHITADIGKIPDIDRISDGDLPELMDMSEARQLLHITYGPILNDKIIRPLFFAAMHRFEAEYTEKLKKHFEKHLTLLGVPALKTI
ncbi:MAG: tagaturonate epimerase family protein [Victivallales bacterium]|nr:tagaturonate epimerase family protein [Victivallales bacterium]